MKISDRVSNQVNRTKENIDTKEFFSRIDLISDQIEAADLLVFNTFQRLVTTCHKKRNRS